MSAGSTTLTGRNDPVTLTDDRTFLGYVFGKCVDDAGDDTGLIMVSVSKPGQTQLRGCVRIARDRLVAK